MAPISKDTDVLTAPPQAGVSASTPRPEDTSTGSRPQPVALEVPVTVNGARSVEGSDKREPFSETTKTVLVFGSGAVIRLGSPVAAGQLLFLTNEKTKKEVVCQVVKSKNYKSVSGYVELEFTESVVGFWGMRFPSDRIGAQVPPAMPASTVPKNNLVAPISAIPKPVSPVASGAPRISEVPPARTHAEPAPLSGPAEVITVAPALSKVQAPAFPASATPVTPAAKKPEVPVIPAPAASSSSLASSLASLLGAPDAPAPTALKPPSRPLSTENAQPNQSSGDNSSKDLKLQAARLQEQLSSLLFTETPATVPAMPAPASEAKAVLGVATQVLDLAKSEPAPAKAAPPVKNPSAMAKSSLDTEEVKIPSWLEPLARNAAAPAAPQEPVEREDSKDISGIATQEENLLSGSPAEGSHEAELPGVGSLLPLEEGVATHDQPSGGSNRGILYGAIAAAVLLAAGGAWYLLHPTNAAQNASTPGTSTPSLQASATPPALVVPQPAVQPASQNSGASVESAPRSNAAPLSTVPASSAPLTKIPATPQPAVTRDNTRSTATPIPAAATERISRPAAGPEPKKPALGDVHLASPTMKRSAGSPTNGVDAPTISSGSNDADAAGLDPGFSTGNAKQPAAPEAPLPVGGDVKSAELISRVSPVYPALARSQHVSGDVRIDALIDAGGHVTTMKVISGPTLLHQAAMDALRQWKYQPATLDGKQVSMHLTVTVQFRLQ